MATVPFSGAPQVGVELAPIPRYTADASPAAFGVNVAQATENLGKTASHVGDEIFARGIAMQDLYNHSEAQEADAQYMQKAGELHANYSTLQGKAAVDAYPQYIKDLQEARKGIRDGLSNDMSAKLFDSQSLSTMGRTIFNGAGHAATQNKTYAIGSSKARVQAISDQALSSPQDEDHFQDSLDDAEDEVRAQGQLQGWGEDQTNEAIAQQKSDLWSQRIRGLTRTQPFVAGEMLNKAIENGDVRGEDVAKLQNYVQQQQVQVGSRNIAARVNSGYDLHWGQGVVEAPRAREAVAKYESNGNYEVANGPTVTDASGNTGHAIGRYQIMSYNLAPWLKEAGMPAMTEAEFKKNHAAQDALFDFKFGQYQTKYGSFNSAVKAWFGGEGSVNADPSKLTDKYHTGKDYLLATNRTLAQSASLADKQDYGDQIARESAPDNTLLPEATRVQVDAQHNRDLAAIKNETFTTKNTILQAIVGAQGQKLPTSPEELTADPKLSAAWDRLGELDPLAKFRYTKMLAGNLKDDYGPSDQAVKAMSRIKAFAHDNGAEFAAMDLDKWREENHIPRAQFGQILDLQYRKNQDPSVRDVQVDKAMRVLEPSLPADFKDKRNREDYLLFKGNLMDQLEDFYNEKKRPANLEEIKKIGTGLMSQQHSKEFWFESSTDNLYHLPIPPDLIRDVRAKEPNITDEEIKRRYIRLQYHQLFGKPSSNGKE